MSPNVNVRNLPGFGIPEFDHVDISDRVGATNNINIAVYRKAGAVSPKLDATEQYLNQILALFAADPAPRSDWPAAPHTFEETVAEAVASLSQP